MPERTSIPQRDRVSSDQATGLSAGLRVGSYELIRELGRGGMGVVFLARDVKLGRRVAIKFVLNADPEFLKRFLVEARATARCQHENIVVIHEVDNYDGLPFMVLEYLEGQSLDRLLGSGPLPATRAVELVLPIARALTHAHGHGIVHRDLKPENVFVTESGTVKVLDFGIATAFGGPEPASGRKRARRPTPGLPMNITQAGLAVGTPQYMAPEQILGDRVDGRTDIWAFGVVLHLLLTGRHPLGLEVDQGAIAVMATTPEPFPPCAKLIPGSDPKLTALVDRCLHKRPDARFASADELVAALESLASARRGRRTDDDRCPYPGLVSFREADAERYFGREADVARMLSRLPEQPLMAVVGPSGAGKSSFVRAGVVPALQRRGEWEVHTLRPGTQPLAVLAALADRLDTSTRPLAEGGASRSGSLRDRLIEEPGSLGEILRARAGVSRAQQLLFIDQFEELYTLVPDPDERRTVVRCLMGAADDPASPVRVVLSVRSDFVDRAAEDAEFIGQLTRGLLFLGPMQRASLRQALEAPAALRGHEFESPELVERMLDDLGDTSSPLPLLQFAAAQLWAERNTEARTLTRASYDGMGGIVGALASHADRVLNEMTPDERRRVRAMFARLVTADQTRAVTPVDELLALDPDSSGQRELLDRLAEARLVVIHTDAEVTTAEIIHEALIDSWPTLRGWIDADRDDAAFLHQLRTSAALWQRRQRSTGLLWRGDALAEARLWRKRSPDHPLAPVEDAFLRAAFSEANRARRLRKALWAGVIAVLAIVAAGAVIALLQIREAEKNAVIEAGRARDEAARATAALEQAQRAEHKATRASSQAQEASEQASRESERARRASEQVALGKEDLRQANDRLAEAAERARTERDRARSAQAEAEREAARARQAEAELRTKQAELSKLLAEQAERIEKLKQRSEKISNDL